MSQVTIAKEFIGEDGKHYDPDSVILEDSEVEYGVRLLSDETIVVAAGTLMEKYATGVYFYKFDEEPNADGIEYEYVIKTVTDGHTHYETNKIIGYTSNDLATKRNTDKYLNWIKTEFQPLTLITPDDTLKQLLENAIRYFNTHSAYKISTMVQASGTSRIQLPKAFKQVQGVYPSRSSTWVWGDHPMWSLLGVMVLDNVTTDLIMLTEAFRNYRIYVGTNFRWFFEASRDPNIGGYLYTVNAPAGTPGFFVVGSKRITAAEDIKEEFIQDFILRYLKALVKQVEGNSLRKANMILPTGLDGAEMVSEGMEDMKDLQLELAENGRWCSFLRRQ